MSKWDKEVRKLANRIKSEDAYLAKHGYCLVVKLDDDAYSRFELIKLSNSQVVYTEDAMRVEPVYEMAKQLIRMQK